MPRVQTLRSTQSLPGTSRPIALLLANATLLLLAGILATSGSPARAQGEEVKRPKLVVAERVHETGEIARDQVVDHTFKISNAGNAELKIDKLMLPPNLEVVSRPTVLAPGEAGEIHVRVPLLYDKPAALLKQIAVKSNDPEAPTTMLELKILSTEYVTAKPGYARWNSVQYEQRGTISQRLTAKDGQDFAVLRTSSPPAGITLTAPVVKKEPGSPQEWKMDLTLAEDAPVGAITGTVLVYINHPKQSIVPIPLSGFMRPVMAVTPEKLSVGEVKPTQKWLPAIVVQSFATAPIHVTKVEHDLKGFPQATIETRTLGREYKIGIALDMATLPKGAFRGTMKIHTDSARTPLLIVPIDGTIP